MNPGLLGLALSYAITLTSILGSTVETFTQLEMLMVAIERIDEYTNDTPVEDLLGVNRSCHNHMFVYLFICLFVCLFICLFACLFVCLFTL